MSHKRVSEEEDEQPPCSLKRARSLKTMKQIEPYALMIDVPEASVLQHVESEDVRSLLKGSLGALVAKEKQLEEEILGSLEHLSTSDAASNASTLCHHPSSQPPSPVSPPEAVVPELPCFGLGLTRQSSFVPASLLTEVELERQADLRKRCAAALAGLARRSFRSLTHSRPRGASG